MNGQQILPELTGPAPLYVGRVEAARLIGVSVRTLDQLVQDNSIPSRKLRGRRVFSPEVLRGWSVDGVYDTDDME